MNITGFLQCMSGYSFQSGNLLAYYDFSQKDSNIIFNQKYPTGSGYIGLNININSTPGILIGSGSSIGSQSCTKIGDKLDLDNLHCLFNLNLSGCQNTGKVESTIVLTSKTKASDTSGFNFGINSSNRLFFENNNKIYTLNKELREKNIINLSISQNKFINFGFLDFTSDSYVSANAETSLDKPLSDLYLINYPSGSTSSYSGLMGSINHLAVLEDSILEKDILSKCLFCTGINYISGNVSGSVISITGIQLDYTYESGVTGYQAVTYPISKENGSKITGYYLSGISGLILVDTQLKSMASSGAYNIYSSFSPALQYNTGEILTYLVSDLLFNADVSGYKVEIYTYSGYQPYKNLKISNLTLPQVSNLNLNLYINGLLETENVDYNLAGDQITVVNGGDSDSLIANYSSNPTRTIDYLTTGQFNTNAGGEVCVTGSGFYSGYDVYLNGQKLIRNDSFYSGLYSSNAAVIFYSGVLLTGSEIKFYPVDGNPISYVKSGFNAATYEISGIPGYSEQIWANGVLQSKESDYILTQKCFKDPFYFLSSTSSLLVYNNDDYYLNI